MRTRRLTLRRETLAALDTADLANVAGAAAHTFPEPGCVVELVKEATSYLVSCSMIQGCPSSPCTR